MLNMSAAAPKRTFIAHTELQARPLLMRSFSASLFCVRYPGVPVSGLPAFGCDPGMPPSPILNVARSCSLVIFTLTVAEILGDGKWEPGSRDLDVLEVWSGVASVQRAAAARGLRAAAFDVKQGADQDLTTEQGFHNVLQLVLQLRPGPSIAQCTQTSGLCTKHPPTQPSNAISGPGGLLMMAPVCSSFTFPNIVNTKRSRADFSGDPGYPGVSPLSLERTQL